MTTPQPKQRPGLSCPKCGGHTMRAAFTRHRPGAVVRVRKCQACGHRIRTAERMVSRSA